MVRFFKSTQTAALFILPVIVIALWAQGFFKAEFLFAGKSGILYSIIYQGLAPLPKFVLVLFAMVLITFEAIYLNLLLNKYEVLYKPTYLPSLFYVLLMSYSSNVIVFHPILLINLLLLPVLDRTFSLFKNEAPTSAIFDSCFLLSLCTLIYFPSIVLLIFFLAALAFMRPFHPREWAVAFVGFTLPLYFIAVYAFCTDGLKQTAHDFASQFVFYKIERAMFDKPFIIFLSYFSFIFLLTIIKLRANFYKNSIRTRSEQQSLLIFLFLTGAACFFIEKISFIHFTMAVIPICTFLGYFYTSIKRRLVLTEISFWILVILIIRNYF
jgi:hypothetical protein